MNKKGVLTLVIPKRRNVISVTRLVRRAQRAEALRAQNKMLAAKFAASLISNTGKPSGQV